MAHLVTVDSVWPKAIELAGNLFATPKQLDTMRAIRQLMFETGAAHADPFKQCLLAVVLEEDESIVMDLVQAANGQPIIGGHWMQLSISPDGITSMATGPFGGVVTDPPGYN